MTEIHFPREIIAEIATQANRDYPYETCGLLLGQADTARRTVQRIYPVDNVAPEDQKRRYFQADPRGVLHGQQLADEQGLSVIGVYHTHPDHPAEPSQTDREQAWDEFSYLIVEVRAVGIGRMRCWRFNSGQFQEEMIVSSD